MTFEQWYKFHVSDNLNTTLANWCKIAWDAQQKKIDELEKENKYLRRKIEEYLNSYPGDHL